MTSVTDTPTDAAEFRYVHGHREDAFPGAPRQQPSPGPDATFDADRLAVYFGVPGLSRDLHPVSPWSGDRRDRLAPPRPLGTSDVTELRDRLVESVRRAIAGHEVVAVAMSGGMDSAVLVDIAARLCRRDGRRLVVLTLDITDDLGRRAGAIAGRQLEFLGVQAEHVRVAPSLTRWPDPPWCPVGPRFDAWPCWHHGLVLSAAELGATVLLQGAGSDQLLQTTPYLDTELVRRRMWRALKQYRADNTEKSLVSDALAVSGRITSAARANLYWATAWPGFTTDRGAPLLDEARVGAVQRWLRSFQEAAIRATVQAGPTWAEATLMHRMFPYDVLDDVGPIPSAMPFLDPEFARYAYDLPLWMRFSPDLPSAYLRSKALVMSLLPSGFETVLSHRRQRFYKTYRRYWQSRTREPAAVAELGLVSADWRSRSRDAFDLAMVMNCEDWIRGARDHAGVQDVLT